MRAELDPAFPERSASPYVDLRLSGTLHLSRRADAAVRAAVLYDEKHCWVPGDEIDKLVRSGGKWLATHPERT